MSFILGTSITHQPLYINLPTEYHTAILLLSLQNIMSIRECNEFWEWIACRVKGFWSTHGFYLIYWFRNDLNRVTTCPVLIYYHHPEPCLVINHPQHQQRGSLLPTMQWNVICLSLTWCFCNPVVILFPERLLSLLFGEMYL